MNQNNFDEQHKYYDDLAKKYSNLSTIKIDEVDNKNTALIIVDMINGFTKEGAMSSEYSLSINDGIAQLSNKFDNKGIPIIAFADCHSIDSIEFKSFPKHCLELSSESEITDEIKNSCKYTLINKKSVNGFFESEFINFIELHNNIKTFYIVGCCTDFCVMNFALSLKIYHIAHNIEIEVIVISELTETFNSDIHNREFWNVVSYSNMEQNGIRIIKNIEI